ncbi:MAG TPA: hypothetical protein VF299_07040 [Mycobacterium sp.]
MSADWVVTLTFDLNPSMEAMYSWEDELAAVGGRVTRTGLRGVRGVDITTHAPGELLMFDAARQSAGHVGRVVDAAPAAMAIVRERPVHDEDETSGAPRSAPPNSSARDSANPELMSTAEIAAELQVTRQRVYQLRDLAAFPEPLADLRAGAVWDAAAVRKFAREWERRPGRPRAGTAPLRRG